MGIRVEVKKIVGGCLMNGTLETFKKVQHNFILDAAGIFENKLNHLLDTKKKSKNPILKKEEPQIMEAEIVEVKRYAR